jgi:hypothetical protein
MYSPEKAIELLLQWVPTTLNSMQDRVPMPDAPEVPGTLLTILTVPWTLGGMRPQEAGMLVPEIEPSETEETWMILGS